MNNGITNTFKKKKKNACKTALYGKVREKRETGGWMINWGSHTKHRYLSVKIGLN